MSFEQDYISILEFAKQKVRDFALSMDAEELVNESFINLYDKPYTIGLFYKEIKNICLKEKHNAPQTAQYGKRYVYNGFAGDYVCVKCKQTKDVSEFRIEERANGRRNIRTRCRKCESGINAEYSKMINQQRYGVCYDKKQYDKNKDKSEFKKKNKKRVAEFVENNREKWNQYLRSRSKLDSQNLTDAYIRKQIRNKYKETAAAVINNPHFISEFRNKIIQKRLAKSKKVA